MPIYPKMKITCRLLFIAAFLLSPVWACAQNTGLASKVIPVIDSFSTRNPAEKVFIHTDKPFYALADTIWLKAYVLDDALAYSKQSGLLYVELIDDTGKVIIRQSMPVKLGITFGQIALDPKLVTGGTYQLRAYTNWMQNQPGHFFKRQLYIGNTDAGGWIIKSDTRVENKTGKTNLTAGLLISDKDGSAARLKDIELKVVNGSKVIGSNKLQTDLNGKLNVNFDLPQQSGTGKLYLSATDLGKGSKYIIPLTPNRPEFTDLQFMPESGQLVSGLPTRIGFKAIAEDGRGTSIQGDIIDSKGETVTTFKSRYNGMGSFDLQPAPGETYMARIKLPGGGIKSYPLPIVKPAGINLRVDNIDARDSLSVTINATPDILSGTDNYLLVAQSAGKIAYAANLSFARGVIHGSISKNRFGNGITRFTLFNSARQPIAERLTFINHHNQLNIAVNTSAQAIHPKDSVALQISVTDKNGKPVSGSFSLALTDNEQVKPDSTNAPNLLSYMLHTGDLKSEVENPGYYFEGKYQNRDLALDDLLLTQGWVGYNWQDVFNLNYQAQFKAEPEIVVTGQITRLGGKSVGGLPVALLSAKKPLLAMDTISDANGRFTFRSLPRLDTAAFIVQVKDKKGKVFEAMANVDEFVPAKVSADAVKQYAPWYVNSDTTLLNYLKQSSRYNKAIDLIKYPAGSTQLRNVIIKDKKIVKGSHNLNGSGNADQVLDEQELIKAGKMSLLDLLRKQINGFNTRTLQDRETKEIRSFYAISDKQLKVIIDGMELDLNITPEDITNENSYLNYVQNRLMLFSAEDVKGIEVLYNTNYVAKYKSNFNVSVEKPGSVPSTNICYTCLPPRYANLAYIEITTWAGTGIYPFRKTGVYLYRPLPISWPKQFYKPKYTAKSNNILADLLSTVLWEPNIITNSEGKATVWFYAKSKAGKYTAIIQGANLDGQVGYQKMDLTIK